VVRDTSNLPRRVAGPNLASRDTFRDNRASADHGASPDRDTFQDHRVRPEENLIFYQYISPCDLVGAVRGPMFRSYSM